MSTSALTAADYSEWLGFSGLYLFNVSHADRYRTYEGKISDAGLAAKVVFDFLDDNPGGINLQIWRNANVYEMAADAGWRVTLTAGSLEKIGAPRVAAKMRTIKNTSIGAMFEEGDDPMTMMEKFKSIDPAKMMEEFRTSLARAAPDMAAKSGMPMPKPPAPDQEIESKEQIEHLLERFVKSHEHVLRADMVKHGDPRTKPGFDPNERMAELDRLRHAHYDREKQQEEVETMGRHMEDIEKQLAKNPKLKPGKIAKQRRAIVQCYREYVKRPENELIPAMQAWLKKAERFQVKHSSVFKFKASSEPALAKRVEAIGDCVIDVGSKETSISWDEPTGLTCDWTTFSLSMKFPLDDKKSLTALLDAYDRLKKNFAKHQAELRQEVLDSFFVGYEHLDQIGLLDDYERDDNGRPTEASILQNAGGGSIHMTVPEPGTDDVVIQLWFRIDWDEEHGLELSISDEAEVAPAKDVLEICNIQFQDSGPPVTPEALTAFEKEHNVTLPADYRGFLLKHNGGKPEPNHIKLKADGGGMPVYVDELFTLKDFGDELDLHRANDLPEQYAPIGKVRMAGPFGDNTRCNLIIGVSGKKQGKVLAAMSLTDFMPPGAMPEEFGGGMAVAAYESCCQPVAPNFAAFLSRLTPPPGKSEPAWLVALRAGDVQAFLATKVKLDEQYVPYGAIRIQTVLDYLALEAAPAFLQELVQNAAVKPRQLRDAWQRSSLKTERFKLLLPLLGKDQLCWAFAAHDLWDNAKLLEQLAAAKVNLEAGIGPEGETPLHLAVQAHRPDGVRWLLSHGASPKTPDQYGRTALIWAESDRQLECLKLLMDAGESLESMFPHMPTWKDKLRLLKSRWMNHFDALAEYLRSKGLSVD